MKIQLCGSRLGRVPCQSKLQRKNAGTSSWPSWISHFTGSFVGHSHSEMLCPPALFKKGEEGRNKKEVLHLSRRYTHTHPAEPGKPWKARGRKKNGHDDGQKTRTAQGGRGTDGPPEPTYTAKRTWPKTAHTPKPHDTLRRGTRGELGTKWGTSWWQTKPKQVVNKQDSAPRPTVRAIVPQQARGQVVPQWHQTAIKFQRIRCTTCFTSPETIKRKKTAPKDRVPACVLSLVMWL